MTYRLQLKNVMELDVIHNADCVEGLKQIPSNSVDLVLTDIPYGVVNKHAGNRGVVGQFCKRYANYDKGAADVVTFDLHELTKTLCDKTRGSIYMFCGTEQVSEIRRTMEQQGLSTRLVIWEKTNPSPILGQYMWLSGIECCVFGRKSKATFNLFCKNSVLRFPCGERDIHPTQKPVDLFRYLIQASSNEGDIVLDPFIGSGTTAVACIKEKRHFIGFELNTEFYKSCCKRVRAEQRQLTLF